MRRKRNARLPTLNLWSPLSMALRETRSKALLVPLMDVIMVVGSRCPAKRERRTHILHALTTRSEKVTSRAQLLRPTAWRWSVQRNGGTHNAPHASSTLSHVPCIWHQRLAVAPGPWRNVHPTEIAPIIQQRQKVFVSHPRWSTRGTTSG